MNKVLPTILFFLLSSSFVSSVAAKEYIRDIQSQITIQKEGQIRVKEFIDYDFGLTPKHGIYRRIPFVKTNKEGKKFAMTIDVVNISDENSSPYKFKETTEGEYLNIKIGDPDKTVTGVHTYVIDYVVYGAFTYFSDKDELYWNATGHEWEVPVATGSAIISHPFLNLLVDQIKGDCFAGPIGSREKNCSKDFGSEKVIFSTKVLFNPGEGLTVVAGFPKGTVAVVEPKEYKTFGETWYGKLILGTLFLLGVIAGLLWYVIYPIWIIVKWLRFGRDPKGALGEVRAGYDPPKTESGRELNPAEVGALIDEKVHQRDISALIVDLARRGYIKIEERKKNVFHLITMKNFATDKKLSDDERKFLKSVFGSKKEINLKKSSIYSEIEDLKRNIYTALVKEGYFPQDPSKVRTHYGVIAFIALVTGNLPLIIISLIFGMRMPVKTAEGVQTANIAKSLRNFLSSQERQLKFQADKQMMFERLLPYAVAFGVERVWAERFKDIALKPPEWYSGQSDTHFNSVTFTRSLSSSFNSVAAASAPASTTSSSGFSSGFSGGSSGGGGGGGGGGSW